MENSVVESVTIGTSVGAADFSFIGLIVKADPVVQTVLLLLFASSIWSWAIIFEKWLRLRRINQQTDAFEDRFWSGGSLDDLYEHEGQTPAEPMSSIFSAAMREWRRSLDSPALRHAAGSVRNRIERSMETTMGRETSRLERYMIFLATAGSVAPFVGLFGTVWGIMNSFRSIAATQNTTLVTVAPGIAEALFATALGLAVAIPAVVAYNKLGQDIARYAARLDDFTSEFSAILSRRIEESE